MLIELASPSSTPRSTSTCAPRRHPACRPGDILHAHVDLAHVISVAPVELAFCRPRRCGSGSPLGAALDQHAERGQLAELRRGLGCGLRAQARRMPRPASMKRRDDRGRARSFDLEIELADQRRPLGLFLIDVPGVFLGRGGERIAALGRDALLHFVVGRRALPARCSASR